MATLTDLISGTERQTQDNASVLSTEDFQAAVLQALEEYSKRRPLRKLYDMAGDGTTVLFALPTDWQDRWSTIVSIEAPQGQTPPSILADTAYRLDWDIVGATTVLRLRFITAPPSGTTARMLYTTGHTASTLPSIHNGAVQSLAASLAVQWLAQRYAQQTETTLTVDLADREARSRLYAARSQELRKIFDEVVPGPNRRQLQLARG